MHIAGGLYRELCEVPAWDQHLGSGARAAAAIIEISPESTLHTFVEEPNSEAVRNLEALGVRVVPNHTTVSIAFSYFHPLSRPLVIPKLDTIAKYGLMSIEAPSVLRFGMLEGSAVVTARRAVYDPQTSQDPENFRSNGSTADALAIVLNEDEVRAMAGRDSVEEGAKQLLTDSRADVIIVKRGSKGLMVCDAISQIYMPAYKSPRVFKIGTGDIFSAVFAVHWAELNCTPALAADIASRAVATYADLVQLPVPVMPEHHYPKIPIGTPGIILLEGSIGTLGERYVLEEARYCLRMLGGDVVCPKLDRLTSDDLEISAVLVCADGYGDDISYLFRLARGGSKVVVFSEKDTNISSRLIEESNAVVMSDFTTAIYHSYWASVRFDPEILMADNG